VYQKLIAAECKAYIEIRACDERDYESLLLRLVKQASRNGAESIYVCDRAGRIEDGMMTGYFCLNEEAGFVLPKELEDWKQDGWYVTRDEKKHLTADADEE